MTVSWTDQVLNPSVISWGAENHLYDRGCDENDEAKRGDILPQVEIDNRWPETQHILQVLHEPEKEKQTKKKKKKILRISRAVAPVSADTRKTSQLVLPFSTIYPGNRYIFQDDHDSERQTSGVVVKHGDKVIS